MKISVLIKSVPDSATVLRVGEDHKSVVIDNDTPIMNPYDEYALEEAVKLKESMGGEVIAVSMGKVSAKKIIRAALARGADSAFFINSHCTGPMTSRDVSKVLATVLRSIAPDIIFAGKQAIDDDAAQIPERVAEILGLSHASCITSFELQGGTAEVNREIEGGNFTVQLPLPALLSVSKGINIPRYPTMPNIMKAKQKEIKETTPEELGFSFTAADPDLAVDAISQPRQRRRLKILHGTIETQTQRLFAIIGEET